MFTGLVEQIGTIENIETLGEARRVRVGVGDAVFLANAQIGEKYFREWNVPDGD